MQADKSRKRETEKQEARFPPKTKGKKKYKIKKKKKRFINQMPQEEPVIQKKLKMERGVEAVC